VDDHDQEGDVFSIEEAAQHRPNAFGTSAAKDPIDQAVRYMHAVKNKHTSTDARVQEENAKFAFIFDEHEIVMLTKENTVWTAVRAWARFDCFFGFLVICNSAIEVCTDIYWGDEKVLETESTTYRMCDNLFLAVFIVEWCYRLSEEREGLLGMLKHRWTLFDLIILVIGVLDIWVFGRGYSTLSSWRMLRLARIARLTRLFKGQPVLWILMKGLAKSIAPLAWGVVLMLIAAYIFGLILFEMVGNVDSTSLIQAAGSDAYHWGSLGASMLSVMQLATYDGAADIMRHIIGGAEPQNPAMVSILIPVVNVMSLGLMNFMLAVLLTATFEVLHQESNLSHVSEKIKRHKALMRLRKFIHRRCLGENPIGSGGDEMTITRQTIKRWIEQDKGGVKHRDVSFVSIAASHSPIRRSRSNEGSGKLQELIAAAGMDEDSIDRIFDELVKLHGHETHVNIDDFIIALNILQCDVHPLHVTYWLGGIRSKYERCVYVCEMLEALNIVLDDASKQVEPLLREFNAPKRIAKTKHNAAVLIEADKDAERAEKDQEAHDNHEEIVKAWEKKKQENKIFEVNSQFGEVSPAERELLKKAKQRSRQAEKWVRFDCCFMVVVLLNGVTIAIDATKEKPFERDFTSRVAGIGDYSWVVMEFIFYAIYILEFGFRTTLHFQFAHNAASNAPIRTVHGFIPELIFSMSRKDAYQVCCHLPVMINDTYICYDLFLIGLATVDNFILRFVLTGGQYVMMLKLFRAFRLLRLARLLYLLHELNELIESMYASAVIVGWATLLMVGVCFMAAIFLTDHMENCVHDDPEVARGWGTLEDKVLSLLKIATFAHWGDQVHIVADACGPWQYGFMLAFACLTGFGIINLVTGIAVQAAFRALDTEAEGSQSKDRAELKDKLQRAKDKVFRIMESESDHKRANDRLATRIATRNYFLLWKFHHNDKKPKLGQVKTPAKQAAEQTAADEISKNAKNKEEHLSSRLLGVFGMADEDSDDGVPSDVPSDEPAVVGAESPAMVEELPLAELVDTDSVKNYIQDLWGSELQMKAVHVDKEMLGTRELMLILKDAPLIKVMKRLGMKINHFIMVFQRLDVHNHGLVRTGEFIEGMLRVNDKVAGIDVSSAKSNTRQLWWDLRKMEADATICCDTWLNTCCEMRGVVAIGSDRCHDDLEEEEDHAAMCGSRAHEREMDIRYDELNRANIEMVAKEIKLSKYMHSLVDKLNHRGDHYAGVSVGILEEEEDVVSLHSVESTWD